MAAALDDFDASIIINPLVYDEAKHRQTLEESLESIISGAALLADSRYISTIIVTLYSYLLNHSALIMNLIMLKGTAKVTAQGVEGPCKLLPAKQARFGNLAGSGGRG